MDDAFEKWWRDQPIADNGFYGDVARSAWQAALRHGAEVCRSVPGDFYDPLYNRGVGDCAQALEREVTADKHVPSVEKGTKL